MSSGMVFDIKRYAIHDGPGIRTTVFLKGCPLRCPWCHNPEGQNPEAETMISTVPGKAPNGATGKEVVGRVMKVEEVMVEIEKDILFFDQSGGGVTFSGGEPLAQPEFLTSLLAICKGRNIHTCLDTCGYASSEVFCSVIDNVDLFLYDLKIMNDREHQKYTGVSNRLILENLKILDARGKKVVIRFLVIPGITDTKENISETIDFIASLKTVRDVSLLPHHRIAGQKYKRLRRKNEMENVPAATPKRMAAVGAEFERYGNRVTVGA